MTSGVVGGTYEVATVVVDVVVLVKLDVSVVVVSVVKVEVSTIVVPVM